MAVEFRKTERGFDLYEFTDLYGQTSSLQKSSLATENAIWFGIDGARMHLTSEMVEQMLPFLMRFAYTGDLVERD